MNHQNESATDSRRVGILTREVQTRILNVSASGCLIETNARMAVGTTGSLSVELGGRIYADDVQVIRCQPIEGAGSVYHVGARFLWTAPPADGTLRSILEHAQFGYGQASTLVL